MRKRRAALVALGATAALVAATACGTDEGGTGSDGPDFSAKPSGTLNAWGFNNPDDVGKARLAHAKQQLSGVTIKLDSTNFDAQKFTTRVASGNVPDVVQMSREQVATYAAQGLILPLDTCYSDNKVDPKQRYYPAVVDEVTYDDQVWAVPQFYQPAAILLNREVMEAAGVKDADLDTSKPDALLAAIGKMYKAGGGVPKTLGLDPNSTGQINLWLLGLGGKLTDSDGKPALNDPANVHAVELLKQINDAQGGFAKVKSFSDAFDAFGEKNQFVMNQVGAQAHAQWYPNVLSPYKDDIKLGAVPFKDRDGNPVTVASGTAFVVPAMAKNPAAGCAWALALTSQESWMAAGEARAKSVEEEKGIYTGLFTGSPEADKAIRDKWVKPSGNAGFDQTIETFYTVVDKGKSSPASPAGQQIQQELLNGVTAALLGKKPAQQALEDAQKAAMRAYENIAGN